MVALRAANKMLLKRTPLGARWASSWWAHVDPVPKDCRAAITEAFWADPSPNKVNVTVGAYRDDDGKPVVMDCVREAEARVVGNLNMEYLPMGGSNHMVQQALRIAYGENAEFNRIAAVQSLSGTGATRLFADFQKRYHPESEIYVPDPTWDNEIYDLLLNAMFSSLNNQNAPNGSFFLFYACAHFPTGVDPTEEQWKDISQLIKDKGHLSFFDMVNQGFASGDLERDAKAIKIFLQDGNLLGIDQSFAKSMGLYGQRVGCLSVVCEDEKQATNITTRLQQIARPMYSNPPFHGALIVSIILSDPDLKKLWLKEMKVMTDRIIDMRMALRENLEKLGSPLSWEHITKQIGMFCYSGITPKQIDCLMSEFHVYMLPKGEISIAGVTTKNVEYLANAIHEVTKSS